METPTLVNNIIFKAIGLVLDARWKKHQFLFMQCKKGILLCWYMFTHIKIILILMCLTYCASLVNGQIGLQSWTAKWNWSISMFWVYCFVFPFQRRGVETLMRMWKGSRDRFCVIHIHLHSPQEFHKASFSPQPHALLPPREDHYFPFVFLI